MEGVCQSSMYGHWWDFLVCASMGMCLCFCVCSHRDRTRTLDALVYHFLHYSLETGFFTEPGDRLAGTKSQQSFCLCHTLAPTHQSWLRLQANETTPDLFVLAAGNSSLCANTASALSYWPTSLASSLWFLLVSIPLSTVRIPDCSLSLGMWGIFVKAILTLQSAKFAISCSQAMN